MLCAFGVLRWIGHVGLRPPRNDGRVAAIRVMLWASSFHLWGIAVDCRVEVCCGNIDRAKNFKTREKRLEDLKNFKTILDYNSI